MLQIIIIRHGETSWNKKEIFRGRKDINLSKTGEIQVKLLAKKLSNLKIKSIYTSPLKRAKQTAEAIASFKRLPVQELGGLIDIDFGKWEGRPLKEIKENYPQDYLLWLSFPHKVKFPEGESLSIARQRAVKDVLKTMERIKEGILVFVSHRVINKLLLLHFLGLNNSYFWQIKQDVAGYSILEKIPDLPVHATRTQTSRWVLIKHNDTCHLNKLKFKRLSDF